MFTFSMLVEGTGEEAYKWGVDYVMSRCFGACIKKVTISEKREGVFKVSVTFID